jgi:hypothetical protein
MGTSAALYARRRNEDGSHDPACETCFTAATDPERLATLAEREKPHDCDSSFLADRGCFHRAELLSASASPRPGEC